MPEVTALDWESFLLNHPHVHLLQTSAWGELKSAFGWEPVYVLVEDKECVTGLLGALVLFRRLPMDYSLAYIPKGPVGIGETKGGVPKWDALWPEMDALCRRRKAVFLKVEPDLWVTSKLSYVPGDIQSPHPETLANFSLPGFRLSNQNIQPTSTLLVDLSGDEEEVLARMKQKTRYNVRLAMKKGVAANPSSDIDAFFHLMRITSERNAFGVHSLEYYRKAYELFQARGECEMLLAVFRGKPIAAIMVFTHGKCAWYFYGASSDEHRELMPAYLLQWEAMRWARSRGCSSYDLWGVPNEEESTLEANFTHRSDGLWGVYRFKRGFGGQLLHTVGSWDRIYHPLMYAVYHWLVGKRARD